MRNNQNSKKGLKTAKVRWLSYVERIKKVWGQEEETAEDEGNKSRVSNAFWKEKSNEHILIYI